MEELTCKKCGKVIEGFSKKHTEWQMMQHQLKHRHDEKFKKKEKKK